MTSSSSEPQAVSPAAETCCCSWTGGKDCNLALLRAWRDPSLRVSCLVVFRPEGSKSKSFDAHPLNLMDAQSSSLGLPLHRVVLPSSKSYRDGYVDAIKWLRDEHGVSVICTGDMDLVGSMTTNWITDCAAAAGGVRAYHPLWEADRASCLNDLVRENFTVLFSCVKQPWFDESWCGRALDERAIEEMTTMSEAPASLEDGVDAVELHPKDPRRLPLDLGGEQGEYHTMCIDGPLYSRPIELELGRPKRTVTEPAKEGEERWWTYDGQQWWTLGEFTVKKNRDGIQEEKGKSSSPC
uniref:Diphthine--ammonia ligase n=1 Tax=Odontella aurita TaxID=265563 RepID=A0A7S4KAS3_9STRA|mmetsp:Transcript_827/g.2367  ORF Transcript_827/g.2367 Transcript_827/m.2367 type:complete len:296 (+) Transcript_827:72-959(+)